MSERLSAKVASLSEFMKEIDESFLSDLDDVLFGDPEFQAARKELVNEINKDIQPLKEMKTSLKTRGSLSKKESVNFNDDEYNETKKSINKTEEVNIDEMTVEEILERIRCKCRHFRAKFTILSLAGEGEYMSEGSDFTYSTSTTTSSTLEGVIKVKKQEITQSLQEEQPNCIEFQNVKDIAIKFIDTLLFDAQQHLLAQRAPESDDVSDDLYAEGVIDLYRPDGDIISEAYSTELGLPLIREFTPKVGRDLILDTICTWNLKKKWSYCIKFIQENSDTCSDFYVYEVAWSLPTMSYPIPQATASVFFTIEASRVIPDVCPVKVRYNFETERYKFSLEDDIQHEKFLNNILTCKISFFKTIRM